MSIRIKLATIAIFNFFLFFAKINRVVYYFQILIFIIITNKRGYLRVPSFEFLISSYYYLARLRFIIIQLFY